MDSAEGGELMAKIRFFKPEMWTDEKFVEVSPLARLLFMGMWSFACDNGHLNKSSKQLKLRILPADNCDIDALLNELSDGGLIAIFDGFVKVINLAEHQRPDLRFLVFCEHCETDENTTYTPRDKRERPKSARSAHDERPKSARRNGDGDGDGDGDGGSRVAATTRKRATKIPKDWKPTPEHLERALAADLDLGKQADKFRAHAAEKGRTAVNWNAAFTRWLMNAEEYASRDKQQSQPQKPSISDVPMESRCDVCAKTEDVCRKYFADDHEYTPWNWNR